MDSKANHEVEDAMNPALRPCALQVEFVVEMSGIAGTGDQKTEVPAPSEPLPNIQETTATSVFRCVVSGPMGPNRLESVAFIKGLLWKANNLQPCLT